MKGNDLGPIQDTTLPQHSQGGTEEDNKITRTEQPVLGPENLSPVPYKRRSRWPRRLKRGFAAARLLGLRVRITPGMWMSVSCECCVLPGRGPWDWPIPRLEKSYRVRCVCLCVISKPRQGEGLDPVGYRTMGVGVGVLTNTKQKCQSFDRRLILPVLLNCA